MAKARKRRSTSSPSPAGRADPLKLPTPLTHPLFERQQRELRKLRERMDQLGLLGDQDQHRRLAQMQRELRERIGLTTDQTPPAPPLPQRKRKEGAGRKPTLSPAEIARGRKIFREALTANPKLLTKTRDEIAAHLGRIFKPKRSVSVDTLKRHIIRPVLDAK